jgi:hypothetical protein
MPVVELNGFDETGIIGKYLRFTRVGIRKENELRPFVYNLLHFGSVTATKDFLNGMDDAAKIRYVRTILADPAIDVSQYVFSSDHQIDVLRQFSMLEGKSLFRTRGEIIAERARAGPESSFGIIANYLLRYARSPFWMEAFMKSYGFRMIVEDLLNTSRVLRNPGILDYRVISQIDGGFPFAFWWQTFLSPGNAPPRFSTHVTPIYGITKGDEYYPVVSMAGNIAYISNTVTGMMYPQAVTQLPRMRMDRLNLFYDEYSSRVATPRSLKRVLFVGGIPRDLKYSIPYILHSKSNYNLVYEPFGIEYKLGGSLRSFYKAFGRYPQNDLAVVGRTNRPEDQEILKECEAHAVERKNASEFVDDYAEFSQALVREARSSNLNRDHITKVETTVNRSQDAVKRGLQ